LLATEATAFFGEPPLSVWSVQINNKITIACCQADVGGRMVPPPFMDCGLVTGGVFKSPRAGEGDFATRLQLENR
jgi:hypothetical protein